MSITEICDLPMREKFQIMEILWNDMRISLENAETPRDHQDILNSRRAQVDKGEASLLDWDQVKNTVGRI